MKIVIDIPEELYDRLIIKGKDISEEETSTILDIIADGTVLPNDATNVDIIKALYGFEPNKNSCIMPKDKCNGNPCECDVCQYNDWWNKPYKVDIEQVSN